MRTKVSKAATKTDDVPHELTNITVKEVSVVDRAANKRTFLVTKNDKNPRTENAVKFLTERNKSAGGDDLASQLDARDAAAVQKTDAEKALEAKDAADALAFAAEKERLAKGGAPAPVVVASAVAPVTAPVIVDASKALEQLAAVAASVAPITPVAAAVAPVTTPTKKDDLPVEVTIVASPEPLSESALALKTAILSGIDLITQKVGEWRKAVEAADKNNTDVSGRPYCMWEYSYYLCRMIDNLSGIGGPEWDVLNATIGKFDIAKSGNKAITATRVGVLKAVHEGMQHCTGTMTKVMKELTDETPDEVVTPDASASFAKAAPVAAPVLATVAPVSPEVIAKMDAVLSQVAALSANGQKQETMIASLQTIVASQANELRKSRDEVSSNAISPDKEKVNKGIQDNGNLEWSENEDMAPRGSWRARAV